jgi:translation initiation factor 2 subunit 1
VIVCKVLHVNEERGHIDLSLRRVNETLKRNKLNEIKQEQKAEKIIELVAEKLKKEAKKAYEEITRPIFEKYDMVHFAFNDVALDNTTLTELKIPKEYHKEIEELIRKRFKPEKIPVGGILKLQTYAPDGVEIIKKLLKDLEKMKNTDIKYLGAGAYKITIDSDDVKKDEKILDEKVQQLLETIEKHDGTGSFVKEAAEE